ncbi:MAG: hypothetical protein ACI90E_002990, partial [Yoonia sp.]
CCILGGSAMTHHPHVHMIVPGGGLSVDGAKWIASRKNFSYLFGFCPVCITASFWKG